MLSRSDRILVSVFALVWLLGAVFLMSPRVIYSQTSGDAVLERRAQLEQELATIEEEIARQQEILQSKQRETVSIERDVAILNAQIEGATLSIRAKNLTIERLGRNINDKTKTIGELDRRIERGKQSLAQLVRKTNELDSYSIAEVMLSSRELSEFFADIDSFVSIKSALYTLFEEIRATKGEAETEREALDAERRQEIDARVIIEEKKRVIERSEKQKKELLSLSRQQVKAYEAVLSERETRAAQIRTALFSLRDTAAIPFGTALSYATEAQKKTGVRPAFLLAIMTQESNLGEHVGSCFLSDTKTGDGIGKNTGGKMPRTMNPTRDVPVFLRIVKDLGRDPFQTPVSCWPPTYVGGKPSGWGGAMGPSQFIASTWALFEDEIARFTGHALPDPWIPEDAFVASSIYLRDLGANKGGYSAERNAACRYYSGSSCPDTKSNKTARDRDIIRYGDSVMKIVQNIQENMIDPLQDF